MKIVLQTHFLWLFVKDLKECPLKPSFDPLINIDNKSLIPMSLKYKNWIILKKEYLDWLYFDSVAIDLI